MIQDLLLQLLGPYNTIPVFCKLKFASNFLLIGISRNANHF